MRQVLPKKSRGRRAERETALPDGSFVCCRMAAVSVSGQDQRLSTWRMWRSAFGVRGSPPPPSSTKKSGDFSAKGLLPKTKNWKPRKPRNPKTNKNPKKKYKKGHSGSVSPVYWILVAAAGSWFLLFLLLPAFYGFVCVCSFHQYHIYTYIYIFLISLSLFIIVWTFCLDSSLLCLGLIVRFNLITIYDLCMEIFFGVAASSIRLNSIMFGQDSLLMNWQNIFLNDPERYGSGNPPDRQNLSHAIAVEMMS